MIDEKIIKEFKDWLSLSASEATKESYSSTLKTYCLGRPTEDINRKDFFVDFVNGLRERNLSLGTVSRHVFALKKFLLFLGDKYELAVFDLNSIKCRKAKPPNPVYLKDPEIQAIRNLPVITLLNLRDRALFEFLLYSGCRISEAISIKWRDIDFERGEVVISGKGEKRRMVFLDKSKDWLLQYLKRRANDSLALFLNQYQKPLTRQHAYRAVKDLGQRAGLKLYPHILRHTFGTYLIWAGVDPRTVQEMMGHEDLETTLKYYVAVNYERMKMAHMRFGRLLTIDR